MKIGLGTVQLGMPYGIANHAGQVPADRACAIVARAFAAGVQVFDTAADYGDAESILGAALAPGERLRVVTKLPRLPADIAETAAIERWARDTLARSLRRLRRTRLAALLVHHASDLLGTRGAQLYAGLLALKHEGQVAAIGASVYAAQEIEALLARYALDIVQLPLNLLDQRLVRGGQLQRLRAAGVEIHARSLLLQGLLAMPGDGPPAAWLDPWRTLLRAFRAAAGAEGLSPLQAAIGFAATVPEIDCAIVGVTSTTELDEVLDAASIRLPAHWYHRFAVNDAALLDPSRWPA
ncbi:MAG: aldo/keto reductase [Gammaproteobacteria bacterium]|nr:aldo/keto reductase [Gammaproteobacteria bacterium]